MHILYVDDSGSPDNPSDSFFVLGGISVFERGLYHLMKAADDLVASFGIGNSNDIELHGSPMYSRHGVWKAIPDKAKREEMLRQALGLLQNQSSVKLFAVAVDRAAISPQDPVEVAFEELCNRFNLFLQRGNSRTSDRTRWDSNQRGLIVMDDTKHEKPIQALARHFRLNGGRWGKFRNLAEVPLFVDSRASRLVQLADLVAYATWRKYEHSDGRFFDPLVRLFDAEGGVIHGLVHRKRANDLCYFHACLSRTQRLLALPHGGSPLRSPPPTSSSQPPSSAASWARSSSCASFYPDRCTRGSS